MVRHRMLDASILSRPVFAIRLDFRRLLLVSAAPLHLFLICVASISPYSRFLNSRASLRFHLSLNHLFVLNDRLARFP